MKTLLTALCLLAATPCLADRYDDKVWTRDWPSPDTTAASGLAVIRPIRLDDWMKQDPKFAARIKTDMKTAAPCTGVPKNFPAVVHLTFGKEAIYAFTKKRVYAVVGDIMRHFAYDYCEVD